MTKGRNEKIEESMISLIASLTEAEINIQLLINTVYYKAQLRKKGNAFMKELKTTIKDYFENNDLTEEQYNLVEENINKKMTFQKDYISGLSFKEQEKVAKFIVDMRSSNDVEGIDTSKEAKDDKVEGDSSVVKIVSLSNEAVLSLKPKGKTTESSKKKHREACFAKAKAMAGKDWKYTDHNVGSDNVLRIFFKKFK